MIIYNTKEKKLKLPEYGRTIQKMVDHCLSLPEKEERTRCANSIANLMAQLFPAEVGPNGDRKKIWDHIFIMSDYSLDVDAPYELRKEDFIKHKAEKVPYYEKSNTYRQYGKHLKDMIREIADMENSVEKDRLIFQIANQMKKILVIQNPENATDSKVFNDIAEITNGGIIIDPSSYRLNEYMDTAAATNQGKKKKKK